MTGALISLRRSARRLAVIGGTLLALLALCVGGCGFQPRGQAGDLDSATLPSPLFISGIDRFSPLYRALESQLAVADIKIAPSAADAAAQLRIHDVSADSRVLSVDSNNRAVEFELAESARFSFYGADGRERLARQDIQVLRILYRPERAILGSDREGVLLRENMREELATRILRHLAAAR
ncbi:MAG: LPS assembly lipoprotein LptE [Sedimenticolaceae bacterium]